jgi:hypothetical protein
MSGGTPISQWIEGTNLKEEGPPLRRALPEAIHRGSSISRARGCQPRIVVWAEAETVPAARAATCGRSRPRWG